MRAAERGLDKEAGMACKRALSHCTLIEDEVVILVVASCDSRNLRIVKKRLFMILYSLGCVCHTFHKKRVLGKLICGVNNFFNTLVVRYNTICI